MARTRQPPGVFCLEGPWSTRLTDESSVRPLFDLLRGLGTVRFLYRDAATVQEFEHYLKLWTQKQYAAYGFGYLAFHGSRGGIGVGRTVYTLERLADFLEGRLEGRILYFAACDTLNVDLADLESLRKKTKARAIGGYTKSVDWIESAAFDLNLIAAVTHYSRVDGGFRYLMRNHAGACEMLGFRAVWKGGSVPG